MALPNNVTQITPRSVMGDVVPAAIPMSEVTQRTHFGKSLDMTRIEGALRRAEVGLMSEITDMGRECLGLDPHTSGIINKRFAQVASLDWDLTAAQGADLDKKLANEIADGVRLQLKLIPEFSQRLYDLAWGAFDGRSALEAKWRVVPDKMKYWATDLKWVMPRRLSFGPERELRLIDPGRDTGYFRPLYPGEGVSLNDYPGKFLVWMPRMFADYQEREGLGPRILYWTFFKRFSWRQRMQLTELFGLPWRIVEIDKDSPANGDAIDKVQEQVEQLGTDTTAVLDKGMKLNIPFPGENSGNIFKMTNEEVDLQMSKLVLWNVGTTDAVANRAESVVHQGQQDLAMRWDGSGLSAAVQQQLVAAIVVLNWGTDALGHMPKFQLRTDPPRDRKAELERVDKVISMGVPVPVSEVREMAGTREPEEDESFILGAPDGNGNFTTKIVDPNETEEAEGEDAAEAAAGVAIPKLDITPSDRALYVTVNEARQSDGLPPLKGPDGDLTIAEFKAKYAPTIAEGAAAESGKTEPTDPSKTPPPFGGGPPGAPPPKGGPMPPKGGAPKPPDASAGKDASTEGKKQEALGDGEVNDQEAEGVDGQKKRAKLEAGVVAYAADSGEVIAVRMPGRPRRACPKCYSVERWVRDDVTDIAKCVDCSNEAPFGEWEAAAVELPMGPYADFDACVADQKRKGHDDESAHRICGAIKQKIEGDETHLERAFGHALARESIELANGQHGTTEALVMRMIREGARITGKMAKSIYEAVPETDDPLAIRRAIDKHEHDVEPLSQSIMRTMVMGAMLGALDADWESENDEVVKPDPFEEMAPEEMERGLQLSTFVATPFAQAISEFLKRKVVTRRAFDRMRAAARQKAFTFAGAASKDMIEVAKSELANAMAEGSDLREFRTRLAQRFEDAGWTPLNKSHVENVFRTNVMSAYNAGRRQQMEQPEVRAARPYWQIMGVSDARTRPNHRRALNKVLSAGDPFWQKGGPPFGYMCRCRVVSRSQEAVDRLGLKVVSGSSLVGLPDEGFGGGDNLLA